MPAPDPDATSVAVGGAGGRRPLWALLVGLLAVALLVVLVVASCGDGDGRSGPTGAATTALTATQSTPTEATTTSAGAAAAPGSGSAVGGGTLTAGRATLLGADAGGIAQQIGRRAVGEDLQVLSLSTNGFFVGSGEDDRQYVEFGGRVGEDEPDSYRPAVGTRVDLAGPVHRAPADPQRTLKLDAEDARTGTQRGAYVNADTIAAAGG